MSTTRHGGRRRRRQPEAQPRAGARGALLAGGADDLGFLFLYELMTGSLDVRLLPDDSPYSWGCVLLRMLPEAGAWLDDPPAVARRFQAWIKRLAAAFPVGTPHAHPFGARSHGNERDPWYNASQHSWLVDASGRTLVRDGAPHKRDAHLTVSDFRFRARCRAQAAAASCVCAAPCCCRCRT